VLGREELLTRPGKHKAGKGCLYLRRLGDVDLRILEQLVVDAVAERRFRYGQAQGGA